MKKICTLALALFLTAALFAGCRGTGTPMDSSSEPTRPTVTESATIPTTEATVPSTEATTDVTTTPTDGMMEPTEQFDDGAIGGNPATGDQARSRGFHGMR